MVADGHGWPREDCWERRRTRLAALVTADQSGSPLAARWPRAVCVAQGHDRSRRGRATGDLSRRGLPPDPWRRPEIVPRSSRRHAGVWRDHPGVRGRQNSLPV